MSLPSHVTSSGSAAAIKSKKSLDDDEQHHQCSPLLLKTPKDCQHLVK
jgi:hypothetical protein